MTDVLDVLAAQLFLGLPVMALISCVFLLTSKQPRSVSVAALLLSAIDATAFVTYWYLWGGAFDDLDAGRSVPAVIDDTMDAALALYGVSSLVLVVLWCTRYVVGRSASARSGSTASGS